MAEGNKGNLTRGKFLKGALGAFGVAAAAAVGLKPSEGAKPHKVVVPIVTDQGYLTGAREKAPVVEGSIGQGGAVVGLYYESKTNLNDPRIKANVEEDIASVKALSERLPVLGYPTIELSAQERYGYDFPAVNKNSIGTYDSDRNQIFVNMEIKDPMERKHLIYHELGGHALDPKKLNKESVGVYVDSETQRLALSAREKLVGEIRRYKGRPAQTGGEQDQIKWKQGVDKNGKPCEERCVGAEKSASSVNWGAAYDLEEKFVRRYPVTWEDIVNASNVYAQDLWENPTEYNRFRDMVGRDDVEIQAAADDELYAEFTGYVLQAQDLGLFDSSYKHPVLDLYWDLKNAAIQPRSKK